MARLSASAAVPWGRGSVGEGVEMHVSEEGTDTLEVPGRLLMKF